MSPSAVDAILLTLQVASLATVLTLLPAVLLGYYFARHETLAARLGFTLLSLPMVLPPTAVGYLLLRMIASDGPLGPRFLGLNINLLLTWQAAMMAAMVMAFPIVLRTARVAFESVDPRLETMSRTLGNGPCKTFRLVSLPLASKGLFAAAILGFARALGEFGATVTVAGNIPQKTQTLSTAIYSAQQVGNNGEATVLIAIALALGFVAIYCTEILIRRNSVESKRA